jgi:lambda family phage tail tape measure protein
MASNNIARLGIVLGIDTASFTADVNKAISENGKLKNAILRDSNAAAGALADLIHATEDYGKTLTKVQQIERETNSGRLRNASPLLKQQLLDQAAAYDKVAMATKNVAGAQFKMNEQQKLGLTYQTTDLFTQIASGGNPFIAIIQQGGQLKDQMGGLGNAMKAIGSLFSVTRVLAGGFAAAIGTVAYAIYAGRDELDKFNDTLTLTGNYAGVTAQDLSSMSKVLADSTNSTIGTAKDAFSAVVASGKFTKDSIGSVTQAILQYAQIAGVDVKVASDKLMSGLDGSASGAKNLNKEMNFLTLAQYKQIEALEKAGKQQEGAKLIADALNTKLAQQRRELGILEQSWQGVKNVVSEFWELLKDIGKPETTDKVIANLDKQIAAVQAALGKDVGGKSRFTQEQEKSLESLKAQKEAILEVERLKGRSATSKDVGNAKKEIDEYDKYKELFKTKANELEKSKIEAQFAARKAGANEMMLLELDTAKKIADAKQEMNQNNMKEDNRAIANNLEIFKNKEIVIKAEAAEKVRLMKAKIAQKEYQEEVDTAKEISDARVAEDARRAALTSASQATTRTLEIDKERLELKSKMLFATEKDQKLALISFEYARKRKEIEGTQDQEELLKQLNRQEQLEKFAVAIEDSTKKTKEMVDSVWGNMSNAIDNFVKTGKLSFKDLARSIIQDLIAIQLKAQATGMFNMLIGSIFSGSISGPSSSASTWGDTQGFADGGDPPVGKISMVGERGPELFIPKTAGTIIPNHALSGMGGTTNVTNNYINAIDTKSFEDRLLGSSNAIWAANKYGEKNLATNYGRT